MAPRSVTLWLWLFCYKKLSQNLLPPGQSVSLTHLVKSRFRNVYLIGLENSKLSLIYRILKFWCCIYFKNISCPWHLMLYFSFSYCQFLVHPYISYIFPFRMLIRGTFSFRWQSITLALIIQGVLIVAFSYMCNQVSKINAFFIKIRWLAYEAQKYLVTNPNRP